MAKSKQRKKKKTKIQSSRLKISGFLHDRWHLMASTSVKIIERRLRDRELSESASELRTVIDFSALDLTSKALSADQPDLRRETRNKLHLRMEKVKQELKENLKRDLKNLTNTITNKDLVSFKFLLFLAALAFPRNQREATLGDIEEKYKKDCQRFSTRKAKTLVAWDIFASVSPVIWEFSRKNGMKLLKLAGLYKVFRLFFG